MQHYKRALIQEFKRKLVPNKVLMLVGARRVGKTEFIHSYLNSLRNKNYMLLNGEDMNDSKLLQERTLVNYKRLFANTSLLVVDEAQNIPQIGLILKFIVDNIKGLKVIATGSSIFDLTNKLGEPLVGRQNVLYMFPLSQIEYNQKENYKQAMDNLEQRMIFGSYPELEQYDSQDDKKDYLYELRNSYLLKDILMFDGIKNSHKIYDLLRLVAYQIGAEVSLSELANNLQLSKNTVEKYLNILTKVFVLFKLGGYSRNLRKEITKSSRWYFYDNGIRNSIIDNFNSLSYRSDVGLLWENYLAAERIKKQHYNKMRLRNYFWRTYDQQELDWLEESADGLTGYEFKWTKFKKVKNPVAFAKAYPTAEFMVINKDNYFDFIV